MNDSRHITAIASQIRQSARRRLFVVEKALAAFRDGDLDTALALIDLCCNERVPAAEDLLLRSEILARKAAHMASAEDSALAFDIDPSLAAVQLKRLSAAAGSANEAIAVAKVLLRQDLRPDVLLECAGRLLADPTRQAVCTLRSVRADVEAEIFARNDSPIELMFHFDRGSQRVLVRPREHLNANAGGILRGRASIAWPMGAAILAVEAPANVLIGRSSLTRPDVTRASEGQRAKSERSIVAGPGQAIVSIIVPVFAGVEETVTALVCVMKHTDWRHARLILVDDRGPDPALAKVLTAFASHPAVTVLRNPANLGFIGSVNRALATVPDGDVVLLNADTAVGPQWLERLSAAAHSADDVGTVTPLSNNGELTSVPRLFQSSVMPQAEELDAINAHLWADHARQTVEIPNGVGFCLYITAACRKAVGLLNEHDFVDGYLEEVDYCLRATAKGFRHLCALDTFVAHKGGTSFRDRRRSLVVKNLRRLERKFPHIRNLTHQFMQAGLLDSVAHDVQIAALQDRSAPPISVQLEIGSDLARLRRHQDTKPDIPVVSLTFQGSNLMTACLQSDGLFSPADMRERLNEEDPLAALMALLQRLAPERVVLDVSDHPAWILDLLVRIGAPVELAVTRAIHQAAVIEQALQRAERQQLQLTIRTASRLSMKELAERGIESSGPPHMERPSRRRREPLRHDGKAAVAVFIEEESRWSERAVERLASDLLQYQRPPNLIVIGEPSPPRGMERLGIIQRLVRPSARAMAEALRARSAVLSLHLIEPHHAVTRWSDELIAADLPLLSSSPYVALSDRYPKAEQVALERLGDSVMARLGLS